MTIVYFDCFAGASGDMLLASLLDAGAQLPAVLEELKKLPLSGYEIKTARVMKRGISALDVTVAVEEKSQPHRHFSDIAKMLRESGLSPKVLETSLAVFTLLAQAEGKIHGRPPEKVHFHEVGAVDSIVDIVGIAAALENLGVKAVYSSPLHVGSGTVRCAHGTIPVPAPATLEVLRGVPVYSRGIEAELLTPTGASVLAVLATFGPMPAMHIKNCGYGAGKKDLEIANIVRAVLGEASSAQSGLREEEAVILEANIDDLNPEIYGYVMEKLFAAGALDVYLSPIQMKKNRPATLLRVLASPAAEKEMLSILFRETTTLGVRRLEARKLMLERNHVTVDSAYGSARVKIGRWDGEIINAVPEYEDCLTLARQHGIPLKEVYRAVTAAYEDQAQK
jgi:pyridinium-3,5-bisthiocarboxylic acid mononucleotide nickel chelatase